MIHRRGVESGRPHLQRPKFLARARKRLFSTQARAEGKAGDAAPCAAPLHFSQSQHPEDYIQLWVQRLRCLNISQTKRTPNV